MSVEDSKWNKRRENLHNGEDPKASLGLHYKCLNHRAQCVIIGVCIFNSLPRTIRALLRQLLGCSGLGLWA